MMISRNDSDIEKLVLENCSIGEYGIEHILEAVTGNRTIKELSLKNNHVRKEIFDALTINVSLTSFIHFNRNLLVVDLSGCKLGDQGV